MLQGATCSSSRRLQTGEQLSVRIRVGKSSPDAPIIHPSPTHGGFIRGTRLRAGQESQYHCQPFTGVHSSPHGRIVRPRNNEHPCKGPRKSASDQCVMYWPWTLVCGLISILFRKAKIGQVEQLKTSGNEFYKSKDYQKAITVSIADRTLRSH
jgi:hypothetical protein